jgi:hypothetical protein
MLSTHVVQPEKCVGLRLGARCIRPPSWIEAPGHTLPLFPPSSELKFRAPGYNLPFSIPDLRVPYFGE